MRERPAEDEVADAISQQVGMVRADLRRRGVVDASGRVDVHAVGDVMGRVAIAVMQTIPVWQERGQVPLAAWATGTARNVLRQAAKEAHDRHRRELSLEQTVVADVVAAPGPGESGAGDDSDFYLEMIRQVRALMLARPGGAVAWQRLVETAEQPVRGRSAREALRAELATVSGLPEAMFGVEPAREQGAGVGESMDERVASADVRVVVDGGQFACRCSVCGVVGAGAAQIAVVMDEMRRHRAWHSSQEEGR